MENHSETPVEKEEKARKWKEQTYENTKGKRNDTATKRNQSLLSRVKRLEEARARSLARSLSLSLSLMVEARVEKPGKTTTTTTIENTKKRKEGRSTLRRKGIDTRLYSKQY